MLEFTFDLSAFEEVEIIPIADWHIGNPLTDEALIAKTCEYIAQEPENPKCARICLLNGDILETITKNSKVGDVFQGQIYTPQTQIAIAKKYLLPLTKTSKKYPQGKIFSFAFGNHDHQRQYKDSGISGATSLACGLNLEDRSSSDGIYTFIRLKGLYRTKDNVIFTVYNTHGSGGGTTVGGKANRVAKIGNTMIADLIVMSHVHTAMTFKEDFIIPQTNKQSTRLHTTTYVITSSMIRYGDYGERASLKPGTIVIPRIFLKQERHYLDRDKVRVEDKFYKKVEVCI